MESRKITVVQTKNQKKSVVMTDATTLGELKSALNEAGIDYEGMTFYEGLSKTELKQDSSILPHDIERNGVVTNELVFMLTNTNKKIKSGAMSRNELYDYIKKNNLKDEVYKRYKKNFTMCKTIDLQIIVEGHMNCNKAAVTTVSKEEIPAYVKKEKEEPKVEVKAEATVSVASQDNSNIKTAIMMLLNNLYDNEYIDLSVKDDIIEVLNHESGTYPEPYSTVEDDMSSPYSDAEIARMMREM